MFDLQMIAPKIVKELGVLIDKNIVIIDHNGFIIASTDATRVNQFHEGALLAIKQKTAVHMTKELAVTLSGVREGMIMPLIIEDTPIGVIGITGLPSEIEKYGKLVHKITQLFVEDFLTRQEKEQKTRVFEYFLIDLLNGTAEVELLEQRAESLNVDTSLYNRIIVMQVERRFELNELESMRNMHLIHPRLQIIQWSFDKIVLLVPNVTRKHLEETLRLFSRKLEKVFKVPFYIGVGNTQNFFNLHLSLQQAMTSLLATSTQQRLVFEEDLKLELLLAEIHEQKAHDYLQRTIGAILHEEELIENLEAWLKNNGSLTEIAESLYIHKNTLSYRLKKIEKILNLELSDTMRKVELTVAIYLYRKFYQN